MIDQGVSVPAQSIDREGLAQALKQALQATMFTSTLRVSPRYLQQMANEMAGLVEAFVQGLLDPALIQQHGEQLAEHGHGHRAVLEQIQAINRHCWKTEAPALQQIAVAGSFTWPLLEGYMRGREALLLREQERTRNALHRAKSQSS